MNGERPGPACVVTDLGVALSGTGIDVVDDIDLVLAPGEVVALVGESGSGKTTVGTALLNYAREGAVIDAGSVVIGDRDLLELPPAQVRRARGDDIAYVPQDPAAALNPSIRIGRQIVELLELRGVGTPAERDAWAREGLRDVGLPDDDEFLARYPHQLSGGQVQRVALAMCFLPRPSVLVLDEPTTGLDVSSQRLVLQTMARLCRDYGIAALYVTHDLAVVGNVADRVLVMYAGQVVEQAPRDALFADPAHPYTRALLDAIPHLDTARSLTGIPGTTPGPGRRPEGCRFHDRCGFAEPRCAETAPALIGVRDAGESPEPEPVSGEPGQHLARCVRIGELPRWDPDRGDIPDADPQRARSVLLEVRDLRVRYGRKEVVHGVSFDVARGEVVALVGESGSGKTTISRAVGGLIDNWTGQIALHDRDGAVHDLARGARRRTARDRQRVQYIFQNPYLSLNPRMTVEQIIARPLKVFGLASGAAARDRVAELLEAVALGPTVARYRTNRLSGGERQRVAIARALAAEPDLLVCDEITSALDVSVQGAIVELLEGLRRDRGIGMLFVTHNLALVRSMAARVQVLHDGSLAEGGETGAVMDRPSQDYTRGLLADTPTL
ncbi:peptide/nickel transport system ATP-binding protein [Naumannella cuiyingiana]|uniref:Peptide/nickel transport system ATP-binding protein n=1 Tax=Naumannella cuiyingiana TaxID=1347891 RepID=A0A7Z0D6D3_9ACTN|nr:ABC transporter ATP-binding protein [Naumannella cuiyingiana]NYI69722.1 peptide/nickel transport system ATP-binding protein [Naumannella cuiyingiana]